MDGGSRACPLTLANRQLTPRAKKYARALLCSVERHAVSIAFGAAAIDLLVGIIVSAHLGGDIRFYDETQYLAIGHHLADSGSFSLVGGLPTAYRTPGYPLVVAAVQWGGLGLPLLRFLNFVFVAVTVVGAYYLTVSFGTRLAGAIAALLTATYPLLIFTATTFYPQTLATALTVLTVLAAVKALHASGGCRIALGACAGLLAGALTMTVPTFAFVIPVLAIWCLVAADRRLAVRACAVLVGSALLLPAAWTVRNTESFHQFIPLTTSSGFNLLVGNHSGATPGGSYNAAVIRPYFAEGSRRHLSESALDSLMGHAAMRWIEGHPISFAELYAGKVLNNFVPANSLATTGESSTFKTVLAYVSYLPLLILLIVRLIWAFRGEPLTPPEWLIVAVYVLNALLLAVFTTRVRYRLPGNPLIIAVAAVSLARLLPVPQRRAGAGEDHRLPDSWDTPTSCERRSLEAGIFQELERGCAVEELDVAAGVERLIVVSRLSRRGRSQRS